MGREAAARVAARPPPELGLPAGLSLIVLEGNDDSAEFWSALRGTRAAYLDLASGETFHRIKATVPRELLYLSLCCHIRLPLEQFLRSLDILVVMISVKAATIAG